MKRPSVLVVEDNPLTLKVARLTLGHEGFLVLEATDGAEALRLVESEQPDLILQDLLLPDMDGFELVSRLRANPKTLGIPIIAFSGFLSRLEHGRAAAAGFSDFLPKPVEPSRLLEVVRSYLPEQVEPKIEVGHLHNLLVVDDDPVQLKLARVMLTGLGYRVLTAADGAEALEVLGRCPVDAVLSDVLMPRVDGFRLCAEIRTNPQWKIPVILVSSNYVEEADRQVAFRMGASAFVVRTPNLSEAIHALETALSQTPLSPPAAPSAPAVPPSPSQLPPVAAHHERVILQLERHAAMNANYAHRSAMHASMLSVLAGVSDALIKSHNLEAALPDVLGSLLEACGVSHGAIFFQRHDDNKVMHLGAAAGYGDKARDGLTRFCGQAEVFERAATSLSPLLLTTSDPAMGAILKVIDAGCALLIPLVADNECLGLLLLASATRDLTEHDWIPFARTMAVQIGQALALSRAFERLKTSEARYRGVVENAGMGIFTLDADRCVTDLNPAMEQILQRSRAEMLGQPVVALVAEDDQDRAAAAYAELLKESRVDVRGRRLRRADGQISICDIWVTRTEIDGVPMAIGVAQDVTERHRIEAQLRLLQTLTLSASESPDLQSALQVILSLIGESAGLHFAAAWLPGGDGLECQAWWTANAPDRKLFRCLTKPGATHGEDFLDRVWATGQPAWLPTMDALLPARFQSAVDLGLRGGLAVPVLAHDEVVAVLEFFYLDAGPHEHLAERVSAAAAQVGPVIARQRAQEALRLSEARYARLCEAGIIGVSVADLDGRILEANDVYLEMLGRTREELLGGGLSWSDQIPEEWQADSQASTARLRATGVAQPWESEIQRPDGSRLAVTVAVAMLNEHQCIALVSDISERKRVEAALGRSEEHLRQAQKMEAVGRLAGGVAHDFNNLLSIILSYSELILEDLGSQDPLRDDLEEIHHAGVRGADLTRQLLMFSRQQVLVPVVLDLNEVLAALGKMLQRILGADVTLLTIPGRDLGHVRIDRGSLEQIILNLTVNARDAMPTGGRLTMETANVHLDSDRAPDHLGAKVGHHVMLAVSDTGSGMDRPTQARIFEPFFTTKAAGQGTGLGLSTVFGIVQASGGSVWVYSEPQVGTAFKIYLPRVQVETSGAPESSQSTPPIEGMPCGTETIMLVEDEDGVRAVAASILRKCGYTVIEADGSDAARLVIDDPSQAIDLLLTDVVMPGVSGPTLAAHAVVARPGLRTLFMSGYTDDTIFRHGVLEARMAYLQKPITPHSLARKVREVLDAQHLVELLG